MAPTVTEYTGRSGPRYSIRGYDPRELVGFLDDLSLPAYDELDANGVSSTRVEVRVDKDILSADALKLIKKKMGKVKKYDGNKCARIYIEGYSMKTIDELFCSLFIMDPSIFDVEDGMRSPWMYSITTRKTPTATDELGQFVEQ